MAPPSKFTMPCAIIITLNSRAAGPLLRGGPAQRACGLSVIAFHRCSSVGNDKQQSLQFYADWRDAAAG